MTEQTEQTEPTEQRHLVVPPVPEAPPQPVTPASAPAPAPAPKDRRVLWAVLRWTAAVVVFAVAGAGTAYGITRMERTDVPGLATESDGRWEYPEIVKPPLPSGSPGPFAEANTAGSHYADLRGLVLPAPEGATPDKALVGKDGWLATKDFLAAYESKGEGETVGALLTDHGLRHIAARGWTTTDGTRTRIYLLQFETAAVAESLEQDYFSSVMAPPYALKGATQSLMDEDFPTKVAVEDVRRYPYTETKPYGAEHVRQAYLVSGDILALVVQSRKGGAGAMPFQQTVVLQSQLLG
ncbi:hypothetical protein [Streptomyces sp. WM6386]|uniref:hypothetical protein n=1 Tax=Streptomyces sp. WM6386 TaxID=1415558 RepID=UPI000619A31B|nr:hypothetical protein [Streptomyces sp. WM6386]KKD07321.1 membrane protein [Streptomyces sp. WM6386]